MVFYKDCVERLEDLGENLHLIILNFLMCEQCPSFSLAFNVPLQCVTVFTYVFSAFFVRCILKSFGAICNDTSKNFNFQLFFAFK